jgi:hypothetical protein
MKWQPYPNDRLVAEHPEGFFVIKSETPVKGVPLFCEVCDCMMKSQYDELSHQKFGCCDRCASAWAYQNVERWLAGGRPTKDEVEKYMSILSSSP